MSEKVPRHRPPPPVEKPKPVEKKEPEVPAAPPAAQPAADNHRVAEDRELGVQNRAAVERTPPVNQPITDRILPPTAGREPNQALTVSFA